MIDVRPVFSINGYLLLSLGLSMLVPAAVGFASASSGWPSFVGMSLITSFIGAALCLGNRQPRRLSLTGRQAFLLAGTAWPLLSAIASLPLLYAAAPLSVTDAVFEAVSGLTTTGSTILTHLDQQSPDILLWRAMLNWLGGLGFLVMAVAVLPMLRIGGMQMFRMERSDNGGKIPSRLSHVAWSVVGVYALLSGAGIVLLWLSGMTAFHAICYGLSAISTGGFSPQDRSMLDAGDISMLVCLTLMILGGSPFYLHLNAWKMRRWAFLSDSQSHWYLSFMGFFSLLMAFWLWAILDMDGERALMLATFEVVSIVTSTGFSAANLNEWGGFAHVTFFILLFIGGCTGSTAGGIKIFRWEVLFKLSAIHLNRQLHPHGVFMVTFNQTALSKDVVQSVLGFMILYMLTFAVFSLGLCAAGLDIMAALSSSAAALSNVAHGLGADVGPLQSYSALPDAAKWLLSFEMLLGRLELLSVAALCSRAFWRE